LKVQGFEQNMALNYIIPLEYFPFAGIRRKKKTLGL